MNFSLGAGPARLTELAAPFSPGDREGIPSASKGDSQTNAGGGVAFRFPRWKEQEADTG